MKNISFLIKPSSSLCNMNCKYCFYNDEAKNRTHKDYGFMSLNTINILLNKVLNSDYDCVNFAFQGGEPTLIGLEFYEYLINMVNKKNKKKIEINYSIQTNGLNLNKRWVDFFKKNKFLVGISLDGTKNIHDLNRIDINGNETYNRIIKSIDLLKKEKVAFNILSVVTKSFANHIDSNLNFFVDNKLMYLQFIPCLDPIYKERGKEKFSLSPEIYGKFLKKTFDYWYNMLASGKHIYIRFFEELMFLIAEKPGINCYTSGKCSNQLVIEADGSVYPCDFYVLDEFKIGNIIEDPIDLLILKGNNMPFIKESDRFKNECAKCKWYPWCKGGCKRDYENGKNYFCAAYKNFFEYAYERLMLLSAMIK